MGVQLGVRMLDSGLRRRGRIRSHVSEEGVGVGEQRRRNSGREGRNGWY